MISVTSLTNLLGGVVKDGENINFDVERVRIERMWDFWRQLCMVANDLDMDGNWYGEDIAVGVIMEAVRNVAMTLEEILSEEFGEERRDAAEYLDLMESREYEMRCRGCVVLPWESLLIKFWEAGDTDKMGNVLVMMMHRIGEVFRNEDFWKGVAA